MTSSFPPIVVDVAEVQDGTFGLPTQTHNTSFAKHHISGISKLGADLNVAVQAAWPTRNSIRYSKAQVLILSWEDDDLGVSREIKPLRRVFENRYHFHVHEYLIPSPAPDTDLDPLMAVTRQVLHFLEVFDRRDTLLIIYYAGHASRINDSSEMPTWSANRHDLDANLPSRNIQALFERAVADVLILLDCCHAAATAATSSQRKGKGVVEVVAAFGYETIAAEVGDDSFTKSLTDELVLASKGKPFSVSALQSRVLNRLKAGLPRMVVDEQGNYVDTTDGYFLMEHQPRRTPIHSMIQESSPKRSIVIAPLHQLDGSQNAVPGSPSQTGTSSSTSSDELSTPDSSSKCLPNPDTHIRSGHIGPYVILAVRINKGEFSIPDWVEWVRSAPAEAKDIHIEGTYDSYSTLAILRMPVTTWNLLPENAAYSFVGFVTSSNTAFKSCCSPSLKCPCGDACSTCDSKFELADVLSDTGLDIERINTDDGSTMSPIRTVEPPRLPAQVPHGHKNRKQTYVSNFDIVTRSTFRPQSEDLFKSGSVTSTKPKTVSQSRSRGAELAPGFLPQPELRHQQLISQGPSKSPEPTENFPWASGLLLAGAVKAISIGTAALSRSAQQDVTPGAQNFKMKSHSPQMHVPQPLVQDSDIYPNFDRTDGDVPKEEKEEIYRQRGAEESAAESVTAEMLKSNPSASSKTSDESLDAYGAPFTWASGSDAAVPGPQSAAPDSTWARDFRQYTADDWLWSCCGCQGHDLMNVNATPACTECGHWRCESCPYEKSVKLARPKLKKRKKGHKH